MDYYTINQMCKNCKGCEAVANGEAECLCDAEIKIEMEVISETGICFDEEDW